MRSNSQGENNNSGNIKNINSQRNSFGRDSFSEENEYRDVVDNEFNIKGVEELNAIDEESQMLEAGSPMMSSHKGMHKFKSKMVTQKFSETNLGSDQLKTIKDHGDS